jgi:hypothetical protein
VPVAVERGFSVLYDDAWKSVGGGSA